MFQCPLRRAWVLRVYVTSARNAREAIVSMPFKTGLGTAGANLDGMGQPMFQCPLRRAWVLRSDHFVASVPMADCQKVSMPFKTGLGTADGTRRGVVDPGRTLGVSMPFKTGLGTAGRRR